MMSAAWGNHDNQGGEEFILSLLQTLSDKYRNLFYESGDQCLGNGIFAVKIASKGQCVCGLVFMDSHDRDKNGESKRYNGDGVYWGKFNYMQKDWYEQTVRTIKDDACGHVVLFAHTPIAAYNDAFNAEIKKNIQTLAYR